MSTKISIFKTTADGEQVNVEVDLTPDVLKQVEPTVMRAIKGSGAQDQIVPGKSLRQVFAPYFQLVDDRLLEMNTRIMASNVLVKKLSPEAQYAVTNIFEVLHGRSRGPAPEAILEEARREHQAAKEATQSANTDVPE